MDVEPGDSESLANGGRSHHAARRDPEVPEADALDQAREVVPGERRTQVSRAIDVPEADAIEQAIEEPVDLERRPRHGARPALVVGHAELMVYESAHVSTIIDRPADDVYAFVSDPRNLARWASGLANGVVESTMAPGSSSRRWDG